MSYSALASQRQVWSCLADKVKAGKINKTLEKKTSTKLGKLPITAMQLATDYENKHSRRPRKVTLYYMVPQQHW